MGDVSELLAGGGAVAILLGLALAFLFGANTVGRPKGGSRPAKPEEPPRPNTAPLDRAEAIADHEATHQQEDVQQAVKGRLDHENPHGLAGSVNRRRR